MAGGQGFVQACICASGCACFRRQKLAMLTAMVGSLVLHFCFTPASAGSTCLCVSDRWQVQPGDVAHALCAMAT